MRASSWWIAFFGAGERPGRARGAFLKNVSMSEDFLNHHFPSTPIMPGALIAESVIQLAG